MNGLSGTDNDCYIIPNTGRHLLLWQLAADRNSTRSSQQQKQRDAACSLRMPPCFASAAVPVFAARGATRAMLAA